MMPDSISISEGVLAVTSTLALLLRVIGLARASRDVSYARREGISGGARILFWQNVRHEAAGLHMKMTLFVLSVYLLTKPQLPPWTVYDVILLGLAAAVVHLDINGVLDIRDRERIKRQRRMDRDQGWCGPDRRRAE